MASTIGTANMINAIQSTRVGLIDKSLIPPMRRSKPFLGRIQRPNDYNSQFR